MPVAATPPEAPTSAPSAPTEIATFLKAWAPPAVAIVGAATAALTSWALLTSRVQALETRVAETAEARANDHELLVQMNMRLKLLVCRQDPPNCPRE